MKEKLVCLTLDFEPDYGGRLSQFRILGNTHNSLKLRKIIDSYEISLTGFIVTSLLKVKLYRNLIDVLFDDVHSHSHYHNLTRTENDSELKLSLSTFNKYFGYRPLGYRSPQGRISKTLLHSLKNNDVKFSSSVFPSFRPLVYNNFWSPKSPFKYDNNLIEIPISCTQTFRIINSLSYFKLLGPNNLINILDNCLLPDLIIFDSHLHDFFPDVNQIEKLPFFLSKLYMHNIDEGLTIFELFITYLLNKGYKFITMSELLSSLAINDLEDVKI